MGDLRLRISEEDADAERLAVLTGYLRAELLQLDVKDVIAPRAGDAAVRQPGRSTSPLSVLCWSLLASPPRGCGQWYPRSKAGSRRGEGPGRRCGWNSAATRWSFRRRARLSGPADRLVHQPSRRRGAPAVNGQRKALIVANDTV